MSDLKQDGQCGRGRLISGHGVENFALVVNLRLLMSSWRNRTSRLSYRQLETTKCPGGDQHPPSDGNQSHFTIVCGCSQQRVVLDLSLKPLHMSMASYGAAFCPSHSKPLERTQIGELGVCQWVCHPISPTSVSSQL